MATVTDPLLIPSSTGQPSKQISGNLDSRVLSVDLSRLWKVYYLHGGNHHVKEKTFLFSGTKEQAIQRGKTHCEHMGYRWIRVEPFLSTLDLDEKLASQ